MHFSPSGWLLVRALPHQAFFSTEKSARKYWLSPTSIVFLTLACWAGFQKLCFHHVQRQIAIHSWWVCDSSSQDYFEKQEQATVAWTFMAHWTLHVKASVSGNCQKEEESNTEDLPRDKTFPASKLQKGLFRIVKNANIGYFTGMMATLQKYPLLRYILAWSFRNIQLLGGQESSGARKMMLGTAVVGKGTPTKWPFSAFLRKSRKSCILWGWSGCRESSKEAQIHHSIQGKPQKSELLIGGHSGGKAPLGSTL